MLKQDSRKAQKRIDFDFKVISVKDAGDECIIEGYANTSTKDRVGDVVLPKAFESSLATYLKNPVLLENHNWDKIAGRVMSAEITDKGLYVKARISDARPDLKTMVREGCLSTFSIGYNENDADYDEETKTKYIKDLELLEISVVSVPANTEASFTVADTKAEKPPVCEKCGAEMQKDGDSYKCMKCMQDSAKAVKIERGENESMDDCVSRGIQTLINEGKDKDQAAAIAYSMCGEGSKDCCPECKDTKSATTIGNLKSFIAAAKEAWGDDFDTEAELALCELYITEGTNMKLNRKQLIDALRASVKSAQAAPISQETAAAASGKAEAPAAPEAPKDEQMEQDALKELMAKLDAIAQACSQILEGMKAEKADEKPADKPKDEEPKPGEEKPKAEDEKSADPELKELTDAEIDEMEAELIQQLDALDDQE